MEDKVDLFLEVENALNIVISPVIKNVLLINGFNNRLVLGNICEQDITDMENFMRETASLLIDEREYESYYGLFHQKKDCFKFVPGQKKTILLMAQFFRSKYCQQIYTPTPTNTSTSTDATSSNKEIADKAATVQIKSRDCEGSSEGSSKDKIIDFTNENRHISSTVKKWLKEKCSTPDVWNTLKEKYARITFETKYGPKNEVCCIMRCFCGNSYKILKASKKENLAPRWVFGNFYKHLMAHLQQSDSTLESTARSASYYKPTSKQQNLITNFLSKNVNVKEKTETSNNGMPEETDNETRTSTAMEGQSITLSSNIGEVGNKPKINILSDQVIRESNETSSKPCKDYADDNSNIGEHYESDQDLIALEQSSLISPDSLHMIQSSSPTSSKSQSKWSTPKYNRSERSKRKRLYQLTTSAGQQQTCITSYFSVIDEVCNLTTNIIEDKDKVGLQLQGVLANFESNLQAANDHENSNSPGQFLRWLFDLSSKNSCQSKYRNFYNDPIKCFSLYLFYVGGRLLYETLYANMRSALPSISCLNKFVSKNSSNIEEGFFDYDGICSFIDQRNLPKVLWISEDATRVTSKIEYDSKTNKLIGFTLPLVDGMPVRDSFFATSAKAIQDHFQNGIRSNYAYVVMAQPLSPAAPGYCLAAFDTDNRFTADDVIKRWQHIKLNFKKRGIIVLGFGSDGDTRLLKAMRQGAQLSNPDSSSHPEWRWFQGNFDADDGTSYVQDTVHIATKLRTRLLNSKVVLMFGNLFATAKHLEQLIAEHSKDQHLLTNSDLKLEDKMNFEAADKLCSINVINLLNKVPENAGTVAYLKLMRLIIDSYLDPKMDLKNRIYSIWYSVFFLRIWRQWLKIKKYKLGEHFISSNCYTCVELNAHSLINIIVKIRDNPVLSSDMFIPTLFGSQNCEQIFRTTRSITSTYSTVVNFTVKDIIGRLDRIKTVNNIMHDLKDVIVFPREQKRQEKISAEKNSVLATDLKNFTDTMIVDAVESAMQDALTHTRELGMFVEDDCLFSAAIPRTGDIIKDQGLEDEEDVQIDDNIIDISNESFSNCSIDSSTNQLQGFASLPIETEETNDEDFSNPGSKLYKDLCDISRVGIMDDLIMRNYDQKLEDQVVERGPYVRVSVNNVTKIIRKSSLCWLLEETKNRVSTDRLKRFVTTSKVGQGKAKQIIGNRQKSLPKTRKRRINSELDNSDSSADTAIIEYDDSTDTETFSQYDDDQNAAMEIVEIDEEIRKDEVTDLGLSSTLIDINNFYAVYYDEGWFIGKIVRICHNATDGENRVIEMKFLKQNKRKKCEFKWPAREDVSNIEDQYIFFGPIDVNQSETNTLIISEDLITKISVAYSKKKLNC